MVLYGRGLRGRPAGQAVVAEVEDAIDVYFKSCSPGDEVAKVQQQKDYSWLHNNSSTRITRSRPVIPPLLELHLIQLGNKLTIGEAEVARARFRRAVSVASLGPLSASGSPDFVTSCTDPEGNAVQSRSTPSHPGGNSVPRARCCNCPESGVATTDVVVDQLVRMMRKVVLDIMDDNATTTLLRSRVSRQRLTATTRDDRIRSSSSSSLSSSCSSTSSSSMSKVAVISPANEVNNTVSTPATSSVTPPDAPTVSEFPSATSTPTCSSPSSLFSSPSSSSSGEKRREGEAMMRPDLRLPSPCNNEEEESSAFGAAAEVASPLTPLQGSSEIKHIEPIFLRCPKRVEENLAASHSFVRSREGGVVPPLRGSMSPRPKKTSPTTAGDELQMRLNAILHTTKRDCIDNNLRNSSSSLRLVGDGRLDECQVPCPSSPVSQSSLSPYHDQVSTDRNIEITKTIENAETTMSFYDDVSSHPFSLSCEGPPDHPSSPVFQSPHPSSPLGGGMVGNPIVGMPAHPAANHMESHVSWRDTEDELQRTCGPMYAKPPRYSIFTISGTLTDPFGTNAKYSLRSLSTAHF